MENLVKKGYRVLGKILGVHDFGIKSHAQVGEDLIINFLFRDKEIPSIKYLEIGCNQPVKNNNTYLFYSQGNTGVCVEADKSLIPLIKRKRPKDNILNMGVAVSKATEANFYIFDLKGINTFNKEEADKRVASGKYKITEVAKVQLININKLIEQNFNTYPDFLSIDIEGLDLEVLKSLNFDKFPVPVICAETCTYSETHNRPKDPAIADFLHSKGYETYADTYVNTIFVNKNWFYNSR